MNPKEVYDKVASLEDRIRHLESERQQLIEALIKGVKRIKAMENRLMFYRIGKMPSEKDHKEMDKTRDAEEQIKTALRNAGIDLEEKT